MIGLSEFVVVLAILAGAVLLFLKITRRPEQSQNRK